jgi:uncharacterized protein (TIGR02246 family)
MSLRRLSTLLALTALAACRQAETPEQMAARLAAESDSAKAAVDAINVNYARWMNANAADSVASLFAEDGVLMPPGAPVVAGREAIRTYMAANPMPPGSNMSFTAVDVAANGPMAVERGTYTFTMPAMGRTPATTTNGKYLVHWHRIGGAWLQAATIWSDDAPPPAAPPEARR